LKCRALPGFAVAAGMVAGGWGADAAGAEAPGAGAAGAVTPGVAAPGAPAPTRVEARSSDLLAVGIVQGDRMSIHLSRLLDNAPLRDAAVTVVLRGVVHPTVAEADGSYSVVAKDFTLPGTAAVEFQVAEAQLHEDLRGVLQPPLAAAAAADGGNARQLWWWALNFGVCIGFLWLFSRRKKSAPS
jgi:hypothetical protein